MHPEVANTLHNLARMIEDDDELDSGGFSIGGPSM
jgi:hypothetical protein